MYQAPSMVLDRTNTYPTVAAPHLSADIIVVLLNQLQATKMIDTSHGRIALISTVLVVSAVFPSKGCTHFHFVFISLKYCV